MQSGSGRQTSDGPSTAEPCGWEASRRSSGTRSTRSVGVGFRAQAVMTDDETTRSSIDRLLQRTRSVLDRVPAEELADEMAAGAVVVDTRPVEQRRRDGELPGAVVVDRNVLEWRLDPTSPHRLQSLALGADTRIIVVCNEGYSSSLAAATLRLLGLRRATDLVDGFQGWLVHRGESLAARETVEDLADVEASVTVEQASRSAGPRPSSVDGRCCASPRRGR